MPAQRTRRLLAVLAHPDDESLGMGGTLAKYAAEGVEVFLVTATSGESGRFHGIRPGEPNHPGAAALAEMRERELRQSAAVLGVREVSILGYGDRQLDRADPHEVIGAIVAALRRIRPDIVLSFGPDGAYGHPDHIAISQFTTAAIVAAADASFDTEGIRAGAAPHRVSKLYYFAWSEAMWSAYEAVLGVLTFTVDGVQRHAAPWRDWAITTVIDTASLWPTVWRAVCCHESQLRAFERLADVPADQHEHLWGSQSFYRAMSLVNGGSNRETDLFEGID